MKTLIAALTFSGAVALGATLIPTDASAFGVGIGHRAYIAASQDGILDHNIPYGWPVVDGPTYYSHYRCDPIALADDACGAYD